MDTLLFKRTRAFLIVNIEMEPEMNLGHAECVPTFARLFQSKYAIIGSNDG